MESPWMRMTASGTAGPPVPSMSRPPTSAVTGPEGLPPQLARMATPASSGVPLLRKRGLGPVLNAGRWGRAGTPSLLLEPMSRNGPNDSRRGGERVEALAVVSAKRPSRWSVFSLPAAGIAGERTPQRFAEELRARGLNSEFRARYGSESKTDQESRSASPLAERIRGESLSQALPDDSGSAWGMPPKKSLCSEGLVEHPANPKHESDCDSVGERNPDERE